MALAKSERFLDWPETMFRFPERWRRMFDLVEPYVKMEEFIEGDTLVVRAELPGLDPEKDVDISIDNGLLHIEAQRREEHKEKGSYRSEFSYGSYTRTLPLPPEASEEVKATYSDGILEVRVPMAKPEESKAHKIAVQRA